MNRQESKIASEVVERCDVCRESPAEGVAAIPGASCSAAYCRVCRDGNAHPWWILVANTAAIGGLAEAADWWVVMVDATCARLGLTRERFEADVAESCSAEDLW